MPAAVRTCRRAIRRRPRSLAGMGDLSWRQSAKSGHDQIERLDWSNQPEVELFGGIPPQLPFRGVVAKSPSSSPLVRGRVDEHREVNERGEFRSSGVDTLDDYDRPRFDSDRVGEPAARFPIESLKRRRASVAQRFDGFGSHSLPIEVHLNTGRGRELETLGVRHVPVEVIAVDDRCI